MCRCPNELVDVLQDQSSLVLEDVPTLRAFSPTFTTTPTKHTWDATRHARVVRTVGCCGCGTGHLIDTSKTPVHNQRVPKPDTKRRGPVTLRPSLLPYITLLIAGILYSPNPTVGDASFIYYCKVPTPAYLEKLEGSSLWSLGCWTLSRGSPSEMCDSGCQSAYTHGQR